MKLVLIATLFATALRGTQAGLFGPNVTIPYVIQGSWYWPQQRFQDEPLLVDVIRPEDFPQFCLLFAQVYDIILEESSTAPDLPTQALEAFASRFKGRIVLMTDYEDMNCDGKLRQSIQPRMTAHALILRTPRLYWGGMQGSIRAQPSSHDGDKFEGELRRFPEVRDFPWLRTDLVEFALEAVGLLKSLPLRAEVPAVLTVDFDVRSADMKSTSVTVIFRYGFGFVFLLLSFWCATIVIRRRKRNMPKIVIANVVLCSSFLQAVLLSTVFFIDGDGNTGNLPLFWSWYFYPQMIGSSLASDFLIALLWKGLTESIMMRGNKSSRTGDVLLIACVAACYMIDFVVLPIINWNLVDNLARFSAVSTAHIVLQCAAFLALYLYVRPAMKMLAEGKTSDRKSKTSSDKAKKALLRRLGRQVILTTMASAMTLVTAFVTTFAVSPQNAFQAYLFRGFMSTGRAVNLLTQANVFLPPPKFRTTTSIAPVGTTQVVRRTTGAGTSAQASSSS